MIKGRASLFSSAPTRTLTKKQAYSRYYYAEKIKPVVDERYRKLLIDSGERKEDDTGPLGRIPVDFRMDIVAELYAKESDEVKEAVEKRRLSDTTPAEEESDEILRLQKLQKFQRSVLYFSHHTPSLTSRRI